MSRGARVGVDRDLDRVGAVVGGDPGADPAGGLDRDREGGLQRRLVLGRHQVEAEPLAALGGQRQADQPARLLGHEVDRLRRRELRRHHQVALVLAALVVADDDHAPGADLLDRFLDRRERALPRLVHRVVFLRLCSCDSRLLLSGEWCHQPLDVLRHDVTLDVEPVSPARRRRGSSAPASRGSARPRRQPSPRPATVRLTPARAIEPLLDRVAQQRRLASATRRRRAKPSSSTATTSPTPSTCPWTMWPPSRSEALHRQLQVDPAPRLERAERGQLERLVHRLGAEALLVDLGRRSGRRRRPRPSRRGRSRRRRRARWRSASGRPPRRSRPTRRCRCPGSVR